MCPNIFRVHLRTSKMHNNYQVAMCFPLALWYYIFGHVPSPVLQTCSNINNILQCRMANKLLMMIRVEMIPPVH